MLEEKKNVCVLCTVCPYCNIELALLLDSSSKLIGNAWTQIRYFASSVVDGYNINPSCVRAATIRYNDATAYVDISLNRYNDRHSLQRFIQQLSLLNGGSRLDIALRTLRTSVFASTIVRSGTTLIAVIVTDNLQPSTQLTNEANLAKAQGITIVAVGITRQGRLDTNTLYAVATRSGYITYATTVNDYTQLSGALSVTLPWRCLIAPVTTPATPSTPTGTSSFMCILSATKPVYSRDKTLIKRAHFMDHIVAQERKML